MIRPANPQDLPAIAAIYEAILAEEDAPVRSPSPTGSGASTQPWTPPVPPWRPAPSLPPRKTVRCTAVSTSMGNSCLSTPTSPGSTPPRTTRWASSTPWSFTPPGRARAGRELVAFCEEHCRQQGKRVIRLDTYVNNQPANSMYPRLGYRFAGTSHFLFQGFLPEDLNCYEELL